MVKCGRFLPAGAVVVITGGRFPTLIVDQVWESFMLNIMGL